MYNPRHLSFSNLNRNNGNHLNHNSNSKPLFHLLFYIPPITPLSMHYLRLRSMLPQLRLPFQPPL